jgi:thiol-disulfide isomerase/thioredoxin
MTIRSFAPLAIAALCAALAAQQPATPPAPTQPAAPAAEATDAKAMLGASLRFLQSLPALRLQAKGTMVMPELPEELAGQIDFGDIELPTVEVDIQLALPNRFVLRSEGMGMVDAVCDGKQLLQNNAQFELYSLGDAPKDLLTFLGGPAGMLSPTGAANLRALLAPAGSKRALLDAKTVELLGKVKVGERDAYHLAVRDEGIACELWIQQGAEPYVLRHKPVAPKLDMSQLMGGGEGEEEGEEGQATLQLEPAIDLEFVQINKEVAKDAFAIVEPKGATKVVDLQAAMMEKFQEQMAEMGEMGEVVAPEEGDTGEHGGAGSKHASVGQPVPDVTLPLLGGGEVKLAELKGKVVLLDFWATWCGPCVQGLPKVNEVAGKLAERGVVFYAVNLAEKPETIEKFLTKKELKLQVALADQKMGTKFGVNGIPHTVIVGKDGIVRTVHVGFGPGSEKQLEKDLLAAIEAGEQPKQDEPKKDEPKKDEPKPAGGK